MKTFKTLTYRFLPIVMVMAVWVSCKEDEDQLNLSRQFTPGAFDITEGETSAEIAWSPSLFTVVGEAEYTLELSKDEDFSNVEMSVTTTELHVTIQDTDIDIKTDYYARVKAVGAGGSDDSKWMMSEAFQITGEILILSIREYDVVTDAVLIRWELDEPLTKITITPASGAPFDVTISDAEYNAGQKLVSGLTQNTSYTAEVFNASNVSKGEVAFVTKNAYSSSNVIDLRSITGKPKILRDTLQDVASGSVIWLKRGEIYTIDAADAAATRLITKSITIMSAPEMNPTLAKLHLTTNFNFTAGIVIDSVVFKDIIVKGVRAAGASFDNDYIINSNVAATIGKIRLDNCRITRLRGTVRAQAGTTGTQIANYFVNNCVIDSIREFAIVMASASSAFANVKITNSTFYRCRRYIDHRVTGNTSVVIENCTFNEAPSGGVVGANPPTNFLIDFNTFSTSIQVKNCIIGKTWIETVGNTDSGGVRAGGTSTINVTNTYTLSDYVSTVAAFQLPGTSAYPSASTVVFQSPSTGNFTIIDAAFPGASSAGDPRWRP